MPVYEYICNACHAEVSLFVRSMTSAITATCDRCGSTDLRRAVSKFAVLRGSGGGDLEGLDAMMGDIDEDDPRAVAAWAREMQRESGEDMGAEFDDMVSRMERGEMPGDDHAGHGHEDDLLD